MADENSELVTVRDSGRPPELPETFELLGRMNNAVTLIAGNAQILAQQHDPRQARQLRQFLQQYKELAVRLCETLKRGGAGTAWPGNE